MPDRAEHNRIVVLGDVIDDVVAVPLTVVRQDTDTPASIRYRAGGSAANTAAWLGSVGASVDFVGRVNAGDVRRHEQLLIDARVRPHLAGDPLLPTGTIVVIVDGQQRTMFTERGANDALDPRLVTDELLAGSRLLHFTGYSLFGGQDPELLRNLVERAKAAGARVSVDPGSAGFIHDFGARAFLDLVAGASVIFPNLEEGRVLTGLENPGLIAQELSQSFGLAVVTLGTDGAVFSIDGSRPKFVDSVKSKVLDPTGAGDAFSAGFLDTWLRTENAGAAAKAGARTAAQAVAVIGGRPLV
jgi:sugar/nucleoside kinase (ribokinase family)